LVALLVAASAVAAQAPDARPDEVRALIARASLPQLRRPDVAGYRKTLDAFYRAYGYVPQWFAASAPWRAGLAELSAAPAHGLETADYDFDWLAAEFSAIAGGDRAPERAARADVAMTVSLFRFLSDLHRGRVAPARAGFRFESGSKPFGLGLKLRLAPAAAAAECHCDDPEHDRTPDPEGAVGVPGMVHEPQSDEQRQG